VARRSRPPGERLPRSQPLATPGPEIGAVLPGLLGIAALAIASPWLALVPSTLTAVLLAIAVLQVTYYAVKSVVAGHELLQVVLWLFTACYLIVPAIYQLAYREAAWQDYYIYIDDRRVQNALIVLNVCFAAFGVGSRRRKGRRPLRTESPDGVTATAYPDRPRELELALALAAASLALLPVVVAKTGFAALFSSRSARTKQFEASGVGLEQAGGAVAALYTILPGALALAAAYLLLTRWRRGLRYSPLVLWGSLALVVVYSNPLANTRYVSSVAIVALLFVVLQPRSRRGMTVVAASIVLALFAIYPIANVFRSADAEPEPLSLSSIDFDGFQQLVNAQQYVEENGHPLGIHVVSAALFVVPRSIWEDKSRPASIDVAENRGYAFTNLSLPVFGEFYLDLGFPGAVVLMYGWGRLWRRLDDDWLVGLTAGGARLVPYLAIAQIGIIRGPLGSQVPVSEPTALLLVLSVLPILQGPSLLGLRRRGPEASAGAALNRRAD